MEERFCKECGNELEHIQIVKKGSYCSKSCASKSRNKHRDPNFLEHSEELKYYMIGLIWTDGCLSQQKGKGERITVALKDKELMEQLHDIVCPNRKLYIGKPKKDTHSPSYSIVSMNEDVIVYLKDKGLEKRKSKTLSYPDISNESFGDFFRGVFDGDGSIFINKVGGKEYKHISITSASSEFIRGLKWQLEAFGFNPRIVEDCRGHVEYLKIYRKDEIDRIRDLMYNEKTTFFIERKKNTFYDDIV